MNGSTTTRVSTSAPAGVGDELRRRVSPASVVREHEQLARRTTLRVGGGADLWFEPADEADLVAGLRLAGERNLPVMLIGRGSNLLVRDGGIRGLVVCLAQPHFLRVEIDGTRLRCGAGARLKTVAVEARRHGVAGLEFLEGIPGTVGGALRMNAGAHGGECFNLVREVRVVDARGEVRVLTPADMAPAYRSCPALRAQVAVEALFEGRPAAVEDIDRRMQEFNRKRWASQPAAPSAGCIFKNPDTIPAGRLVDELGLKGERLGGAMVSLEHGNFIVTTGPASASDVLGLIDRIRQRALSERGIHLETEVQIVGEEAAPA